MQFMVIGYDGRDEEAPARRTAAREDHLKSFQELYAKGTILFGSAILNDEGSMIGSMIICDFPSQSDLEEQWLKHEPYVTGQVWQKIKINKAQVPPFLLNK